MIQLFLVYRTIILLNYQRHKLLLFHCRSNISLKYSRKIVGCLVNFPLEKLPFLNLQVQ